MTFPEYWDREAIRLLNEDNSVPDIVERCRHAYEAGWKAAHDELERENEATMLAAALNEVGQKLREQAVQYREWKKANGHI